MAKGGDFEREMAKALSLWWSDGASDDIFYRSQASGGRATVRRKKGKGLENQHGDLTSTDPLGEVFCHGFSVECKTGYQQKRKNQFETVKINWALMDMLDTAQQETTFEKFWCQCLEDADRSKREPLLIFRRTGLRPCIAMWTDLFEWLQKEGQHWITPPPHMTMVTTWGSVTIFNLEKFLEWSRPKLTNEFILTWLPVVRARREI